jgi:hypothetical protein
MSDPPSDKVERFFIAGCQRSGTTLIRLVLECHPLVYCFDETRAYAALAAGRYPLPRGKRLAGFKIPRWTESLEQDPLVDESMRLQVAGLYRGDPILFLYRDVRDTVASMLKLKVTPDQTWLEAYGRSEFFVRMRSSLGSRYAQELQTVVDSGQPAHLVAALIWKYKTQCYFDYLERGWPVLLVPYDRLVAAPEPELRYILAFLGLPWDASLLSHHQLSHPEILADGKTIGSSDPHKPISKDSVGQWQHMFQSREVQEMLALTGELNQKMLRESDRQRSR